MSEPNLHYKTNYEENKKWPISWELWEEDGCADHPGRHWVVMLPDLGAWNGNPVRQKMEQDDINQLLNYFMCWIPEDMYGISRGWAKKKVWTLEEIRAFEQDIESERWDYR